MSLHRACCGCGGCCELLANGPDYIDVTVTFSKTWTTRYCDDVTPGEPCTVGSAWQEGDIVQEGSMGYTLTARLQKCTDPNTGCTRYCCPDIGDPNRIYSIDFSADVTYYLACCDIFTGVYWYGTVYEQSWSWSLTDEVGCPVTAFTLVDNGDGTCEACITGIIDTPDSFTYTCTCYGCNDVTGDDCASEPYPDPAFGIAGASALFSICKTLTTRADLLGAGWAGIDCDPYDGCETEAGCADCDTGCVYTDLGTIEGCMSTNTYDQSVCYTCSQSGSVAAVT